MEIGCAERGRTGPARPCRSAGRAAATALGAILLLVPILAGNPAAAQSAGQSAPSAALAAPAGPSFADLADLVDAAAIVALVQIRSQATVPPDRAPGLAPGSVRLYLEARTEALLAGRSAVGESLAFLADRALVNGRAPRLRRQRMVVFADPVPGSPGQLQLVAPDAMLPADPALVERVRALVAAFAAPDAPPRVTGVRDVISVQGNLAGESETQMFVETATGAPASLSVLRRPGVAPVWGVSWGEVVDAAATAPAPQSVAWYRLACGLPPSLPDDAFLQPPGPDRTRAQEDYRFILDQLGPCGRTRG